MKVFSLILVLLVFACDNTTENRRSEGGGDMDAGTTGDGETKHSIDDVAKEGEQNVEPGLELTMSQAYAPAMARDYLPPPPNDVVKIKSQCVYSATTQNLIAELTLIPALNPVYPHGKPCMANCICTFIAPMPTDCPRPYGSVAKISPPCERKIMGEPYYFGTVTINDNNRAVSPNVRECSRVYNANYHNYLRECRSSCQGKIPPAQPAELTCRR